MNSPQDERGGTDQRAWSPTYGDMGKSKFNPLPLDALHKTGVVGLPQREQRRYAPGETVRYGVVGAYHPQQHRIYPDQQMPTGVVGRPVLNRTYYGTRPRGIIGAPVNGG